ncbi:MAG: hypothetical protein GX800_08980, partial [Clostridiaceae bacterium]|nr:hypothetical protein [Clostridiaceae bacterium]
MAKYEKNEKPYFLDNYKQLLEWNGENEVLISGKIVGLKNRLDMQITDNVLTEFSRIAESISLLLEIYFTNQSIPRPEIYFLSEGKEYVLDINKKPDNPIVYAIEKPVLDCFAHSSNLEPGDDTIEQMQKLLDSNDKFTLATYKISSDRSLYLTNFGNTGSNTDKIHMAISFPDSFTEYKKLKALRYVLSFRNQIGKKIDENFTNDLLSKELRNLKTKKHLQKARASVHNATDKVELYYGGANADVYNP